MTALDFLAAGVRFVRCGVSLTVKGPAGRRDLAEQLRAEVERRVPVLQDLTAARRGRHDSRGYCETCGDPMLHYLRGMCELCGLARRKALAAIIAAPVRPVYAAPPSFRLEAK